jgi:hypothetical protein
MRYDFVHDFKWFKEEPDVMQLCKKYLSELEKFVTEAESLMKKNQSFSSHNNLTKQQTFFHFLFVF